MGVKLYKILVTNLYFAIYQAIYKKEAVFIPLLTLYC